MTKRLYLDIETSLSVVSTFSLWPKFISHDNIMQDWHIICAAWKWEGNDEVFGELTYNRNDKKVVKALCAVILEADEVVYHNGRKFDWKKLNTRVLLNSLPPMAKPRETDTLIQCRKHFAMTSNRLDYISKVLGLEGKLPTSNGLWIRALNKDKLAIDEMLSYNKQDVVILEQVFERLRPYIDLGYNVNIDTNTDVCTHCYSANLQKRGWTHTKTSKYRKYQCKDCKGWSSSGTKEPRDVGPPVR